MRVRDGEGGVIDGAKSLKKLFINTRQFSSSINKYASASAEDADGDVRPVFSAEREAGDGSGRDGRRRTPPF